MRNPEWLSKREVERLHRISGPVLQRLARRAVRGGTPACSFRRKVACRRGWRFEYRAAWVVGVVAEADEAADGCYTDQAGRRWLSAQAAENRWGICFVTLNGWRTQGCVWLGGRKIRSLRRPGRRVDGPIISVNFYLEMDLDDIHAARAEQGRSPKWLDVREVREQYGHGAKKLRGWAREGCPALDGRKLRSRRTLRRREDGEVRRVVAFSADDLDRIAAAAPSADPHEWLTADQAGEQYGFTETTLWRWATKGGCAYLPGKKLGAVNRPERIADGRWVAVRRYSRKDLAVIADQLRTCDHTTPYEDDEGTWIPEGEAVRRTGIKQQVLAYWRKRTLGQASRRKTGGRFGRPLIPDRDLRSKIIARKGKKIRRGALRVLHWGDLQRIVAARAGRAPAEPAASAAPLEVGRLVVNSARTALATAANAELLPAPTDPEAPRGVGTPAVPPGEDAAAGKIPPECRTVPLSLKQAARLMGYGRRREAQKRLRAAMDTGAVRYERLTRQQYVFDRNDFPAEAWGQVVPSGPKSS
jgi:hypothetical protein